MADLSPTPTRPIEPSSPRGVRARWRPYGAVLASRMRSQRSYRMNFALDLASSLLVGLVELAEVWVLYRAAHSIGGLGLAQVLLVYGLADFSFSIADLVAGHCDNLPTFIRAGTLDVFYLRPQPLLLQLVTSDISLRRLMRAGVGAAAFAVGVHMNHVPASPRTVALVLLAVLSGIAIFVANFVAAAGLQFFVLNGSELSNSFTYGGRYAATQPATVWGRPLEVLFGFAFPMVFCGYLPTLELMHLPGPDWLPASAAWAAPLAAAWSWLVAGLAWRSGVRHYQGGGG